MKKNEKASLPISVKLLANRFVQALFEVYDKAYMPKETDLVWFERKIPAKLDDPIWYFFKPLTEKVQINKGLDEAYEKAKKTLLDDPNELTIEAIENFCDFVRVAEKIAFYENDANGPVIVDSKVEDGIKRLVIKDGLYDITLKIYSSHPYKDEGNDTIEIGVERLYGKQMNNHFIVVNRQIQYNDDSDMYLMNTINLILMNHINNTLLEIYDIVKEKKIKGTY